jgi:release factor glutamine methyltransferase
MDSPTGRLEVCDVGAGSGAIGLAIARGVAHAHVVAVEPSEEARRYLQRNLDRWGDGRLRVVASDAATAHQHIDALSVDVVVSNPPYLDRDVDWVDSETGNFDPDVALWADDSGLAVMVDVVEFAAGALHPGGVILVEHGTTHNEAVAEILSRQGFSAITHLNDLTGRPRLTRAVKR